MNLSIIIPVFNEIKLLPKILFKIIKDTKRINKEIIIIDDCSSAVDECELSALVAQFPNASIINTAENGSEKLLMSQ